MGETASHHVDRVRERMEHDIYLALLKLCPGLEARVRKASDQELHYSGDMVGTSPVYASPTSNPVPPCILRLIRDRRVHALTIPVL